MCIRDRVDTFGADHLRLDHTSDAQTRAAREEHLAVGLRRLVRAAAVDALLLVHGLHQDLDGLADALLGTLRDEILGEAGDVGEALGDDVLVQLVVVRRRFRALLVRVAEDADGVQPGAGQEALQFGQVGLGLAGEADDEVGAHTGLGGLAPDGVEQLQEAVGVAEAAHGAQHVGRGVLEGQVEVGGDLGGGGQDVDQARAHLGRLEVAHPDPLDAVDLGQLRQQGLQQADVAEVLAVGGVVLGDQHDLLHALLRQPAGLVQDVAGAAGDEGAAEGGDGAEGAAPVAARGELDRGDRGPVQTAAQRRTGAGGGRDALREVGRAVPGQRDGRGRLLAFGGADRQQLAPVARGVGGVDAAGQDGLQAVRDVRVVVESEDAVGFGQRLGQFLAVSLGHAAHRHDGLGSAVALEVVGLQQRVDGVLLGGLHEATGVDHGDVGVRGVLDELPAVRLQTACELLGIHLVTSAAESDECDGTAFRHGLKTTLSH